MGYTSWPNSGLIASAGQSDATLREFHQTLKGAKRGIMMTKEALSPAAYMEKAVRDALIVENLPAGTETIPVNSVGIIGAGTMGGGIAMNFATKGIQVTIVETSQEALDRGLGTIRKNYTRSAERGRFPLEEVERRMSCITGSLSMNDLAHCDLIIEAVFEDMDLKKSIFMKLDAIAKPGAILASNTSALDVDVIAAQTSRAESVIGLHFFSPANVMKLLEVVRGEKTAAKVVATSMQLAAHIDKIPVLVGVCPGFVGNRMLFHRQVQASRLMERGVMPWRIDDLFHQFGFKMGPFEMADLAGLDIGWKKGMTTGNPLRNALCEMDRRGQKTSAGYYDYDENRRPTPSPVVEKLIREMTSNAALGGPEPDDTEIMELCLFPMINEGAHILEEGKAQRASDVDVVWRYGYGWPEHNGGPMYYASQIGLEKVVRRLDEMSAAQPYYKAAPLLRRLAESGRGFL